MTSYTVQTGAIFPLTRHILTLIYCTLGSWLLPLGDVLFQNESHPSDEICMTSINGRLLLLLCDATKCINIVMKCVWRHCNVIRVRYSLLLRADFSISFANEWANVTGSSPNPIVAENQDGINLYRVVCLTSPFLLLRLPQNCTREIFTDSEFILKTTTHNPVS